MSRHAACPIPSQGVETFIIFYDLFFHVLLACFKQPFYCLLIWPFKDIAVYKTEST